LHARFEIIFVVFVELTGLVLIDIIQKVSSTSTDDLATEANGRIVSLQFENDGSASWLISGRYNLD
jgi:hypothetical protein